MKKYIVLSGSILLLLLTSIIFDHLQFFSMVAPDTALGLAIGLILGGIVGLIIDKHPKHRETSRFK